MYKAFNLSTVKQDPAHKQIQLIFNFDVDKDSITADTFNVVSNNGGHISFSWNVVDDVVYISLNEWPEPNTVYQLIISKNISNIAGIELKNSIRYNMTFESANLSIVSIKSPYNFQKIDDIVIDLEETGNTGKYIVQIAKENRFYNFIYNSEVTEKHLELTIPDIEKGQYYLRVRTLDGTDQYGKWSNVVTFIYKDVCDCEEPKDEGPKADASMPSAWSNMFGNDSEYRNDGTIITDPSVTPDIEDELEIITYPEQGETPTSFIFETDKPLDPNFGEIIVIKREF